MKKEILNKVYIELCKILRKKFPEIGPETTDAAAYYHSKMDQELWADYKECFPSDEGQQHAFDTCLQAASFSATEMLSNPEDLSAFRALHQKYKRKLIEIRRNKARDDPPPPPTHGYALRSLTPR